MRVRLAQRRRRQRCCWRSRTTASAGAGEGRAQGTGLGSKIVKAMALNIGSDLSYADLPSGTRAMMEFKVS